MASTSNKLWKYNRYRYIMTYQERPWLPPPLIIFSHMAQGLRAIYRTFSGGTEQEERCSGLSKYPNVCVCGYKACSAAIYTCLTSLSRLLSFLSASELFLGHEDRKKLHEFEEKCVQVYFHENSEGLHSSQSNRIRTTAKRLDWCYYWCIWTSRDNHEILTPYDVAEKSILKTESICVLCCPMPVKGG